MHYQLMLRIHLRVRGSEIGNNHPSCLPRYFVFPSPSKRMVLVLDIEGRAMEWNKGRITNTHCSLRQRGEGKRSNLPFIDFFILHDQHHHHYYYHLSILLVSNFADRRTFAWDGTIFCIQSIAVKLECIDGAYEDMCAYYINTLTRPPLPLRAPYSIQ